MKKQNKNIKSAALRLLEESSAAEHDMHEYETDIFDELTDAKEEINVDRFVIMHKHNFVKAYNEIKNGKKETHWIWFIFPQLKGLGKSVMAKEYGLTIEEAKLFTKNIYLMNNLKRISNALLNINNKSIIDIVGEPDNLKICSCMTLFKHLTNDKVFSDVLVKYYDDKECDLTLELLKKESL